VAFLLLATIVVLPVSKGIATARSYHPNINDAWYDSLTTLREKSDPQSIINAWWDYGHWAKYVADRRVTLDGTSLQTHLPHWMAKALTTVAPRESFGLLRMLNCASDAFPNPEGAIGAIGKIEATGRDSHASYSIVAGLTVRNRAQAEAFLTEHGFSAPERQEILAASHCDPPDSYLLLSNVLLHKVNRLFGIGQRDPRGRDLAKRIQNMSAREAIAWFTAEFGYTRAEAVALYWRIKAPIGGQTREFVDKAWRHCRARGDDGTMACPISLPSKAGEVRGQFIYRHGDWSKAYFIFTSSGQRGIQLINGTPGLFMVAEGNRLLNVLPKNAIHPKIGVLLDPAKRRIRVGTPAILRSVLVQLLVLDGQYTNLFEKLDERAVSTGERVSTWRVNWAGAAQ
jgi:hypothetical protein